MTPAGVLRSVMSAFEARGLDGMFDLLDDDVRVQMPFEEAHGFTSMDKAAFRRTVELGLSMYDRFEIAIDRVHELAGGTGAVAEYRSDALFAGSQVGYQSRYCGIFLVRDGVIYDWKEYDEPGILQAALAAHSQYGAVAAQDG